MKDEKSGVAVKKSFGLKPNMYSFLVDHRNEHKKTMVVNKTVVVTTSHKEYKDVLLNNKCLRPLMIRFRSTNHRIIAYEINIISKFCFDHKIYIPNNGFYGLALGC